MSAVKKFQENGKIGKKSRRNRSREMGKEQLYRILWEYRWGRRSTTLANGPVNISQLMNLEMKFRDIEGRPLAESKAPPEMRTGVITELTVCPYAGSRNKHFKPMNISALKQMTNHWQVLNDAFSTLRSYHLIKEDREGITPMGFFRLTVAGYMLPSYFLYRSQDNFDNGTLPAELAVIYKAALGMVTTAQVIITKGLVTGHFKPDTVLDATEIYNFAEREGMFIGDTEVCAGSPQLIMELLKVITHPVADEQASCACLPPLEPYFHYVADAEKILLLDFLFPLIVYFHLPPQTITQLFAIILGEATGYDTPVMANEISMEVQLLNIVPGILDSFTDEHRADIFEGLINTFSLSAENNEIIDWLASLGQSTQAEEQFFQQLFELLSDLEYGMAKELPVEAYKLSAQVLASYLWLERKKLYFYYQAQTSMNALLGFEDNARIPDSIDISRMYGKKLRDILSDFFFVEIENSLDKTRFTQFQVENEI